ncbi:hypothetical protein DMN91_007551 [Ooceraea biroi]|uniref:Putative OPA3-like protein n=1 Tax=Ooceraea biroi TaxID=2015173 RepID=A0A026WX77_OOCBI|nr:putative OPA3-like protein CG13603 [Ooceraea biroi]XP_011352273.1 putative OPA3-like protein CG13603 [Ooceraea biroi]EZA60655.1 Putative OPA3-like protein [Ooceraea biroi]RLU20937.1 hypothetical protein DMN91_007551 [Ooceraea biroi]
MPVGVFPALKLGVLFVKQISKPLAKFLVNQAKNHPLFRTYIIIPPAQFYHWTEVKAKMYVMNLGKPTKVAKLNEAMAIELGANLIGEVIIFSVAGACLILEYNRQSTKEAKKEEIRQMQIQKFTDDIQALHTVTLQQESQIHYLQSAINELAKHTKHKIQTPSPVSQTSISGNSSEGNVRENKNSRNAAGAESGNASLIERAIVYYENDVKSEKLS